MVPVTINFNSATFRIMVMADTGSGIKFVRTIARPEMLLTEVRLGIRKKNTAAAMISVANESTANSRRSGFIFI